MLLVHTTAGLRSLSSLDVSGLCGICHYSGKYQYGLKEMGIMYVINFLLSVIPLDFLQTWVYVKNNRSMLATIIFHLFINIMQEKINMTPETKCIQTIFVVIAAIIIVVINKEMFFETKHVGNLLEEKIMNREIN